MSRSNTNRIAAPAALALAAASAFSAHAAQQAWLQAEVAEPLVLKNSLVIRFEPSQTACEKAYGDSWRQTCTPEMRPAGTVLSSEEAPMKMKGVWMWTSPTTLSFTPDEFWKPSSVLELDFSKLRLADEVRITNPRLEVRTAPKSALYVDSAFWSDNFSDSERLVTFEFSFAFPMNRKEVEAGFRASSPSGAMPRLSKPSFIWNKDSTSVVVKMKLEELPEKSVVVRGEVSAASGPFKFRKGVYTVERGSEAAAAMTTIPGRSDIFGVSALSVQTTKSDAFEDSSTVEVGFTLAVDSDEAARSIRIYELPEKMRESALVATDWSTVPAVTQDIIAKAKPVSFTLKNTGEETNLIKLSIGRVDARFLLVEVDSSAASAGKTSFKMQKKFLGVVENTALAPSVDFLQPGGFISLAGAKAIDVSARNVDKVKWRVSKVKPEFMPYLLRDYNAMNAYRVEDAFVESKEGSMPLAAGAARTQFARIPVASEADSKGALYYVEMQGLVRSDNGEESVAASQSRLILASDAGIWVKSEQSGDLAVFASSISKQAPMASARVDVLGANGSVVWSGKTDSEGRADVSGLKSFTRELQPALVRVEGTDGSLGWISLLDASLASYNYRYSSGRASRADGLPAAAAYTDRSIYRPGETARLFAVLKELPEDAPLFARVVDPKGRIASFVKVDASGRMAEAQFTPGKNAPVGRYTFDLAAGADEKSPVLASRSFFVEEFMPETMRIDVVSKKKGWFVGDSGYIEAAVSELAGGPAAGKRLSASVRAYPARSWTFDEYKGFVFPLPAGSSRSGYSDEAPAMTLDSEGKARIDLALRDGFRAVNGTVMLSAFEATGANPTRENASFKAADFTSAAGWRIVGASDSSLLTKDEAVELEVVVVDSDLNPVADREVEVVFGRRIYLTELAADEKGRPYYRDKAMSREASRTKVKTDAQGRARLPLNTSEAGAMTASILMNGSEPASFSYSVAGLSAQDRADDGLVSAKLRIEAPARTESDRVEVNILSPFNGRALASWETNSVLASQWINLKKGHNTVSIPAPADFTGKAYLAVGALRDAKDADKFIEAYAESAAAVEFGRKKADMGVVLQAADKSASNEFKLSVKSAKPGRVAVWAVDSGILAAGGYRAPSPFDDLEADRALQVETRQMLKSLMPENIRLPQSRTTFGGDYEARSGLMKAADANGALAGLNPFRASFDQAAAWWGGVIEVDGEKTLEVKLPKEFQGEATIFAVGVGDDGVYASAQKKVVLEAPLSIAASLPLYASPGDEFDASAAVFGTSKPQSASLSISAPDFGVGQEFALTGADLSKTVRLKAPAEPGVYKVEFKAEASGHEAVKTVEVAVNPASSLKTTTQLSHARNSAAFKFDGDWHDLSYASAASASSAPVPAAQAAFAAAVSGSRQLAEGLLASSSAYSELLLHPEFIDAFGLKASDVREKADESYAALLEAAANPWSLTDEALVQLLEHFFVRSTISAFNTEAASRVNNAVQTRILGRYPKNLDEFRNYAYALWTLARWGEFSVEKTEAVREQFARMNPNDSEDPFWLMLAAVYREMNALDEAERLASRPVKLQASGDWSRLKLMNALARMGYAQPGHVDEAVKQLDLGAADPLEAAGFIASAAQLASSASPIDARLTCSRWREGAVKTVLKKTTAFGVSFETTGCMEGVITAPGSFYMYASQTGYPIAPAAFDKSMRVEHRILDSEGAPASKITAGGVYTIEISLSVPKHAADRNGRVVIEEKLPAGFIWDSSQPEFGFGRGLIESAGTASSRVLLVREPSDPSEKAVYRLKVRAVDTGVFLHPPVYAKSVDDPRLESLGASSSVEILKN